ncbi:MAG: WXG100 family type VII secretion target, partial [Phycicoccus sp.]
MSPLSPAWVDEVPAMYRSTAGSLETHYRRLVGSPDVLDTAAAAWRTQAGSIDAAWQALDEQRARELAGWRGEAAEAFDTRVDTWSGVVSGNATTMRFAADGLELAASALRHHEEGGRLACEHFARVAIRLDLEMRVRLQAGQPLDGARWADRVINEARACLHVIHAHEILLDHVLASMPRRFQLGPDAPWREQIARVRQLRSESSGAGKGSFKPRLVKAKGGIESGISVSQDVNGRTVVSVRTGVSGNGEFKEGRDTSFDALPAGEKDRLRMMASADGGGNVDVTHNYRFDDPDEARRFVDHLRAGDVITRGQRWIESHTGLGGREPDETVYTFTGEAKAKGEMGTEMRPTGDSTRAGGVRTPPTVAQASGGGRGSVVYVRRSDGSSTVGTLRSVELNGRAVSPVGGYAVGESHTWLDSTDYDDRGRPTRVLSQERTVGDLRHEGGTGGAKVTKSFGPLSTEYTETHESRTQRTRTRILDLEESRHRSAYDARGGDRKGWEQYVDRHAVETSQEQRLDSRATTTGA